MQTTPPYEMTYASAALTLALFNVLASKGILSRDDFDNIIEGFSVRFLDDLRQSEKKRYNVSPSRYRDTAFLRNEANGNQ